MGEFLQVTEQCSGQSFRCKAGQSVLKAMEQQGLKCVPVGCRGGGCGFCKVTVLSGDYSCGKMSRVHVPPEALAQGQVLACRIYPLTDLIIECRPQQPAAGHMNEHTTTKAMR
ncbi:MULTISPECIES: 2Fe-2S iron-sulfur cluster binding domain-containing protein [Marinobacter]|uniref:2Fe-2S iron-sulfur cluster binding domain-containing protein n=1 Tax=Marinobacter xiaoshiensis TaxID=3073652 RepID=A0ABU2HCI3_9GAMM|nr:MULTISPECIES: 2Fe-2S iron-sulfur cluster binding domain-containing protein [unclassified Marinobacter]MBK1887175.1 2Fe-2S iron-sulfur cluster binding domain-containing protein [Marinobacter sp. DY40_1A1]MDS1308744.1 2Fe-2S iron-sulfur cluster binding domain-containing protein [Marinobacter sp. F60267]